MIGDIVQIKPHHLPPARRILHHIGDSIAADEEVYTITVGGESGSGKSTISLAIRQLLEEEGHSTFIFHIDDYFKLPPEDNHNRRVQDISHVGPDEVDLSLLQRHIERVKSGVSELKKPLVHYRENRIRQVIVDVEDVDVIIAEGTYATLLEGIDCKIFMLRNYRETYEDRIKRGRDTVDSFSEKVLEIEHRILQDHIEMADLLIDKNYEVRPVSDTKE